ncbi:NUDIX domain-containing protein [Desulfosporosinus sp.]|uniref:NUDIX hydrolase n=1 Tax=Desulfosporosinus sp. TaxID=157907 RepID=UPI0026179A08|nr:NUDIX domain-containing protein [Desulfosporosinus sp.]
MGQTLNRNVARAICISDNKILLAKSKGKCNFYLPGGGIRKNESAAAALIRELKEELDAEALIIGFLGIIENQWSVNDTLNYETTFLFAARIEGSENGYTHSNEETLSFHWTPLDSINLMDIRPECVKDLLLRLSHIYNLSLNTCERF